LRAAPRAAPARATPRHATLRHTHTSAVLCTKMAAESEDEPPPLVPASAPVALRASDGPAATDDAERKVSAKSRPAARVPVTVVAGWLGSGKTTLVQRIAQSAVAQRQRVAIVNNEESATGLEKPFALRDEATQEDLGALACAARRVGARSLFVQAAC
jgi:hypothetical protein